MKHAYAIISISRQLAKTCEKVESLASGIQDTEQNASSASEVFNGLLMDEVEHAQVLTLELTKLMTEASDEAEANADEGDGSAFAEGDLTVQKTAEPTEESGEDGAK